MLRLSVAGRRARAGSLRETVHGTRGIVATTVVIVDVVMTAAETTARGGDQRANAIGEVVVALSGTDDESLLLGSGRTDAEFVEVLLDVLDIATSGTGLVRHDVDRVMKIVE